MDDKEPRATRILKCLAIVREALLAERTQAGHWVGELSASALSTATAVMTFEQCRRQKLDEFEGRRLAEFIDSGRKWLIEHQNEDGGWGDTIRSHSNISTTMLCHATLWATEDQRNTNSQISPTLRRAKAYIDRAGGTAAVVARYGKDHTFSVPILTHCALAGLVDWQKIPRLPFELACLPPKFYKTIRLPVVSYALPALIAIGQVRHHQSRPWNPLTRLLRNWAIEPSLKVLEQIQPSTGGFLEATPLTSFVTMSLAAMGRIEHPVVQQGLRFLLNSMHAEGSWPIDTNLATWVTTLSINALGDAIPVESQAPLLSWLLAQQWQGVHPATNADPGGWAWTDLPGGIPDADDTPGAILAINQLLKNGGETAETERAQAAVSRAVWWLLDLQNRDAGWPTFCRGWGTLPFDRSSCDITAHVIRALTTQSESAALAAPHREMLLLAREYGFRFLKRKQRADGSWLPLWFGNQHAPDDENPTYGTARVLAAYRDANRLDEPEAQAGLRWLIQAQNCDGSWGAGQGLPPCVEETALATEILFDSPESAGQSAAKRGTAWLLDRVDDNSFREPTPIGLYFAKLWYFERLYPLIFTTSALSRAAALLK